MNVFPKDRIVEKTIFNDTIPYIIIKPIKETKDTKVFFYNGGMGSTFTNVKVLNEPIFDNHYIVSFERSEHGKNKKPASKFINYWVKELKSVVEYTKKEFPNKELIMIGESWGAALNSLYFSKKYNVADKLISWNIPNTIVDPSKRPWSERLLYIAPRIIPTLLFNITTYDRKYKEPVEEITNNPIALRMRKVNDNSSSKNNKTILAAWLSFNIAFWAIIKMIKKGMPVWYIQSGEDYFYRKRRMNKLNKKTKNSSHIIFNEKGYHVWTYDPIAKDFLFKKIKEIANI